jgi:hypothetical protein
LESKWQPYVAFIGTVRRLNEAYAFEAGYLDKKRKGVHARDGRHSLNRTSKRGRDG